MICNVSEATLVPSPLTPLGRTAKELNKIITVTGVHESVKEGHELQVEVSLMQDKAREQERRLAEIEELYARKAELMSVKEEEYSKKVQEAK